MLTDIPEIDALYLDEAGFLYVWVAEHSVEICEKVMWMEEEATGYPLCRIRAHQGRDIEKIATGLCLWRRVKEDPHETMNRLSEEIGGMIDER